jgi:hypothetical protein
LIHTLRQIPRKEKLVLKDFCHVKISSSDGLDFYVYYESDLQAANARTLAVFEASGLAEGNYTIQISGYSWNGVNYVPTSPQAKIIHYTFGRWLIVSSPFRSKAEALS